MPLYGAQVVSYIESKRKRENTEMEARKRGVYASVADIPRDEDGFPVAGLVVRHFRDKKRWTQAQLASKLKITELMVRMMETKNKGLDSIERRRALCKLLGIPPILLGLGSLEQLQQLLKPEEPKIQATSIITAHNEVPTVAAYKTMLVHYNQVNLNSVGLSLLADIDAIIPSLYEQVCNTSHRQNKQQLLYVLWEFHRLAAKVHADFEDNIAKTIHNLDKALVIAFELHDANLVAVTHAHVAGIRLLKQTPHLARADIDAAISQLKHASPIVQCDTYGLAARIYHSSAIDLGDSSNAKYFLDESDRLLRNGIQEDGRYTPMGHGGIIRSQLTHIDSLIKMKHSDEALQLIDHTERVNPQVAERGKSLLLLDRALCFLQRDYPEYAMQLLAQSYTQASRLHEVQKVSQIKNIYQELKTGSYKNNRAVLDFEELLLKS